MVKDRQITSLYVQKDNIERLRQVRIKLLAEGYNVSLSGLFNMFLKEVLENPEMIKNLIRKYSNEV